MKPWRGSAGLSLSVFTHITRPPGSGGGLLNAIAGTLIQTAIGTAIGSVLRDMQGFQLIMNFLVMPLFFFSNALFPTAGLPAPLRIAVRLNPLSYGVAGMRDALVGTASLETATDLAVLAALAAVLLGISSFLFSRIEV